jgi:hypothetical protein
LTAQPKDAKPNLTNGRAPPRPTSIGTAGRHQSEQVADISPESPAEIVGIRKQDHCASAITGLKCSQVRPPRDASFTTIGKEEAMPFDGTVYEGRVRSLDKMDKVIDLLSDETRWCKKQLKTPDGRYCIAGAMFAVDATMEIKTAILLAIEQVTGNYYRSIETFNDHPLTTHALVAKVLQRARANMLADSPPATRQRVGAWARLFQVVCEGT